MRNPAARDKTLCGRPSCAVLACPDCAKRWRAMAHVHIQSARCPDLGFCGVPLQGSAVLSVRLGALDEAALRHPRPDHVHPIAYVVSSDARALLATDRSIVPLHAACVLNFGRFLARMGDALAPVLALTDEDEIADADDVDEDAADRRTSRRSLR